MESNASRPTKHFKSQTLFWRVLGIQTSLSIFQFKSVWTHSMTWLSLGSQVVYCEQGSASWTSCPMGAPLASDPNCNATNRRLWTNKIEKRTTNKIADNKMAPRATLLMADEKKHKNKKNLMVLLSVAKSYSNRKQKI